MSPITTAKISNGSMVKMLGAITATVAGLGAVNSYFVVPGILRSVALERRQELKDLTPRREFEMHLTEEVRGRELILRILTRIEDKMK